MLSLLVDRGVALSLPRDLRHELRTPLNHIIGYSEMLIEDFADTGQQELAAALSHVIDDAQAIAALINNLTKNEHGQTRFGDWRSILDRLGERLIMIRATADDAPDWFADLEKIVQATMRLRELFERGESAVALTDPIPSMPSVMFAGTPTEANSEEHYDSALDEETSEKSKSLIGRLLVVDDNKYNLELMARRLRRDGFDASLAQSGKEALQKIQEQEFDVVLLDWLMPELSGLEVLQKLRETYSPHELPVIVVTAKHGSENIVNALVAGANDYITKPVDFPVAIARITTQIYLRKVTQDLKRANEKLRRFSYIDGLTGIPNRRQLNEFFESTWRQVLAKGTPLTVIMLDVDHFKAYNDNYGHEAGDQVLIQLARALAGAVQAASSTSAATSQDDRFLLARYGGEEFAAILPGADLAEGLELAEQCRMAIFDLAIPHAHHSSETRVTISLGVATLLDSERNNPEFNYPQLLQRADQALYGSKRHGRNRVAS